MIKTTARALDGLWEAVRAAHPYETPEWLVITAAGGSEAYLEWVRDCTTANAERRTLNVEPRTLLDGRNAGRRSAPTGLSLAVRRPRPNARPSENAERLLEIGPEVVDVLDARPRRG